MAGPCRFRVESVPAREIDGSWPIYEDVQAMASRELVQSCRHHMPSGARLDDQEAFGQQPPEHSIHVLAIASPRRDELDGLLVSVNCAILTTSMANMDSLIHEPVLVPVDVLPTASVRDVQLAIRYELGEYPSDKRFQSKLHLAQDDDGRWLKYEAFRRIYSGQVESKHRTALAPHALLSTDQCFGQTLHVQAKKTRILVDAFVEKETLSYQDTLRAILSTATSIVRLPETLDQANVDQWRDADCGSMMGIQRLATVFPMLSQDFYVRKETLIVWSGFKKHFQSRFDSETITSTNMKRFLLAGSPGVGKSSLMLLLSGEEGKAYVWEDPEPQDAWKEELIRGRVDELASTARKSTGNVWVCVDGRTQFELKTQLQGQHIDLIVLPFPRYVIPYNLVGDVKKCLLACWSEADLMALGKLRGMAEDECKTRYHVSGGIVSWFFGDLDKAKQIIRRAVERLITVDKRGIAPRLCQSTCDEIFTLTLPVDDSEEEFWTEIRWHHEVTSAFAQALLPEGYHFRWL